MTYSELMEEFTKLTFDEQQLFLAAVMLWVDLHLPELLERKHPLAEIYRKAYQTRTINVPPEL